jgi:hypothetical protein
MTMIDTEHHSRWMRTDGMTRPGPVWLVVAAVRPFALHMLERDLSRRTYGVGCDQFGGSVRAVARGRREDTTD